MHACTYLPGARSAGASASNAWRRGAVVRVWGCSVVFVFASPLLALAAEEEGEEEEKARSRQM